ncbi:hemerythrin domain-containing protein [Sphingomonas sp. UYP23]
MIDHLRQDHDRLRAIITELRALLKDDGARIGMCFAAARWALTRELLRHMAVEKQFLRDQPNECAALSTLSTYNPENLERRYRDHLARWSAMAIDAQWKDYCRDLREMLAALEHNMDFEERSVFPRTERPAATSGNAPPHP